MAPEMGSRRAAGDEAFRRRCAEVLDRLALRGWRVLEERPIDYGRQFRLQGATGEGVLNAYQGRKGFRLVAAGAAAQDLSSDLGLAGPAETTRGAAAPAEDPFDLGLPRVGGDESGKGDYFGPLVVGVWYLVDADQPALKSLGVRDSKSLGRPHVQRLAGALDRLGRGLVEVLEPTAYNEAYEATPNLNRVLERQYGRALQRLQERAQHQGWPGPRAVLIDRFTPSTSGLLHALPGAWTGRLRTEPRAEADVAVAAASILAKAAFDDWLREAGGSWGTPLPAGAGEPVLRAGREFLRDFGREALRQVAKIHFATSRQIEDQ